MAHYDPKVLLAPGKSHKPSKVSQQASPYFNANMQPPAFPHAQFASQQSPPQEQPQFQFANTMSRLHNVQDRSDVPDVKRRKMNPDQQAEEVAFKKPNSDAPRHTSGGELGQYIKDGQKQGAEERARQATNQVDLTKEDDDDIIIVSAPKDKEVCLGRIDNAKVNAHKMPSAKNNGFATPKFWPPMKATIVRRPGNNTHIIGVLDANNIDIGTIDVRTASVLAPLMDQAHMSSLRFQCRLDQRKREPYDYPGQAISATLNIQINIYAPRRMANGIGKLCSQKNIFLVKPLNIAPNVDYVNPHSMKDYTPARKVATTTSKYGSGNSSSHISLTQEEMKRDVSRLFDNLAASDSLPEMDTPKGVKTPLLKHQRQALWFMTDREKDKRSDPNYRANSMWQKQQGFRNTVWYHVITGHTVNEEPEPTRGGILADVMGLGKTLNTLSLICSSMPERQAWVDAKPPEPQDDDDPELEYNYKGTLLVCPLSTVANWEQQIKQHINPGKLRVCVFHGPKRPTEVEELERYDLVITTYSVLSSELRPHKEQASPLASINWFRIVLDEAHLIREQSTSQSKAVCALSAQRRWAITGTPVQNRLEDLGALFKFLRVRPFEETRNFNQFVIAPFKAADVEMVDKLRILVDTITLRRLKDKLDLPPRDEQVVKLDMNAGERSFYNLFHRETHRGVRDIIGAEKLGGRNYAHILKAILRMRLLCAAGQDLLSDEDWNLAKGFHADTPIDLEEVELDKADRTPRQAIELFSMMRDAGVNACAECETYIHPRPRSASSSDSDTDDEDDESALDDATDVLGYIANCNQLVCPSCFPAFSARAQSRAGPDNYGNCPICELYMRMTFFTLRQSEIVAEEMAARAVRNNPRLARQLGRYNGPHTKTRTLVAALEADAAMTPSLEAQGEPPLRSVVFSGWTSHLDLIQLALANSSITFVRLDGSMSRADRTRALHEFATNPAVTCILVSIGAGGLGLNLTAASRVFVMEPQYNPQAEAQAIERVHRLGQKRPVRIVKYIMRDSFEEKMLLIQQRKRAIAELSLDKDKAAKWRGEAAADKAGERMRELRELFK